MDTIAQIALLMLLGMAIFHVFLIFGAPFGDFLWSNKHKVLPLKLRLVSILYVAIYAFVALFLASKMGMVNSITDPLVVTVGMWIFAGCLAVASAISFILPNEKRQSVMGPCYFSLAVAFLYIALYAA